MMPKLYDFELSPECYQVRLLASLLHVGLEIVPVDAFPGREHRRAPFLALNPLGQFPTLIMPDGVGSTQQHCPSLSSRSRSSQALIAPAPRQRARPRRAGLPSR